MTRPALAAAAAAAAFVAAGCSGGQGISTTAAARRADQRLAFAKEFEHESAALGKVLSQSAHEMTSPAHVVHLAVPDRAGTRTFSGYGTLSLGTIVVSRPSTVYWTNDGYDFSMGDAEYSLIIYSDASAGKSSIDVATHRHVEISTLGHWTVKIVPDA